MSLVRAGLIALVAGVVPDPVTCQSTQLSALEGSAPALIVEPIAGTVWAGLAAVWSDPTASPRATGVFLSFYQSSYAGIRLFHGAGAFQWGPRWSIIFGSTEVSELFDSSLINQDPGLASLRARAIWGGLDATITRGRLTGSLGIAIAGDDNVGDVHGGTVAKAHARLLPFRNRRLSVGVHWGRSVGGSLEPSASGREQVDVMMSTGPEELRISLAAAAMWGAYWRYSEVNSGYALAAHVSVLSRLDFGLGLGRYSTSFGTSKYEWQRSVTGGLVIDKLRVGVRYSSTRLGLGSGYGVSLGYESTWAPGNR